MDTASYLSSPAAVRVDNGVARAYEIADGNTVATLTNTTATGAGGSAYAFDGGTVSLNGVSGTSAASSGCFPAPR